MPDWSIQIEGSPATFNPSPRNATIYDNLYWINQTDTDHQPWPLGADGKPAAKGWGVNPIPKQQSSSALPVQGLGSGTIKYCCKIHYKEGGPNETGEIAVLAAPPAQ